MSIHLGNNNTVVIVAQYRSDGSHGLFLGLVRQGIQQKQDCLSIKPTIWYINNTCDGITKQVQVICRAYIKIWYNKSSTLKILTNRPRAQNEARSPPMECPTTFTSRFPYVFLAHLIDFRISYSRVYYHMQNKTYDGPAIGKHKSGTGKMIIKSDIFKYAYMLSQTIRFFQGTPYLAQKKLHKC
jgi:hypothetical protein